MGHERTVTSQVTSESLGWPPSVGPWLLTGKNSRVSHSKVKADLFKGDAHSIDRMWSVSEGERPWEKHTPQRECGPSQTVRGLKIWGG